MTKEIILYFTIFTLFILLLWQIKSYREGFRGGGGGHGGGLHGGGGHGGGGHGGGGHGGGGYGGWRGGGYRGGYYGGGYGGTGWWPDWPYYYAYRDCYTNQFGFVVCPPIA